jgi:CheY-like chemotaxis protein
MLNATGLLTVLVVDDYDDARLTLKRLLETRAYQVLEATNGREASVPS